MKLFCCVISTLLLVVIPALNPLSGQSVKREVETSIKQEEMPDSALALLKKWGDILNGASYYSETDGETSTYEAKFEWGGYGYSVEFSEGGNLLDIEKLITFDELSEALQDTIGKTLNQQYNRYQITRLQQQITGSGENDRGEAIVGHVLEGNFDRLTVRYEMELEGQNKKEMGYFELLFDDNGHLIQTRQIVKRSLDNIW
jgi:hypothetical protein